MTPPSRMADRLPPPTALTRLETAEMDLLVRPIRHALHIEAPALTMDVMDMSIHLLHRAAVLAIPPPAGPIPSSFPKVSSPSPLRRPLL